MPKLSIISGLNTGESFDLKGRETLLGRHPQCQVVLRDSTVSRRHARITKDGNHYYVDDMGSQHGTRVNGEPIRFPCRLMDGDEIQLSQVRLKFSYSPEPEGGSIHDSVPDRPSTIVSSMDLLGGTGLADSQAAPKWRALLEITRSLGVSLDLKRILPRVLDNVFRIFPQATRGCIFLVDQESGDLKPFVIRYVDDRGTGQPPISRTISDLVMADAKAVLSNDAGADERFQASDSVVNLNLRSILCAPLIGSADRPFGMIHLDTQDVRAEFTPDDLEVLVNIANLVAQAVDHANLHATQLDVDRRQRDMNTARQVQQHFLPQERPLLTGYQVFDFYAPVDEVGGDYFGYTPLPDGRLAIAVGDVAGKGVPAALLMARLCSETRFCLVTDILAGDAIDRLNRELCKQTFSYFITLALCVLDTRLHEISVLNAGHMPPLCRRARTGIVESLGNDIVSPPLGIDAEIRYREAKTQLEPGDVVVMYTDGVSEAPNPDGRRFGIERVRAALARGTDARSAIAALLEDVKAFRQSEPQEDDVCIVAFSRDAALVPNE